MKIGDDMLSAEFYTFDGVVLANNIKGYLKKAKVSGEKRPRLRALLVPHPEWSNKYTREMDAWAPVAAFGYAALEKESQSGWIRNVLLIGPSHFPETARVGSPIKDPGTFYFYSIAETDASALATPLGEVKLDRRMPGLNTMRSVELDQQLHEYEFSTQAQLPFLQVVLKDDFTVCPLILGEDDPTEVAKALLPLVDDETFLIVSANLHERSRSYEQTLIQLDTLSQVIQNLDAAAIEQTRNDICRSIALFTLLHIAKMKGWKCQELDLRTSGDTIGEKRWVVGFGCFGFYER
jgi:AmmeMemoRadiSam system protein B